MSSSFFHTFLVLKCHIKQFRYSEFKCWTLANMSVDKQCVSNESPSATFSHSSFVSIFWNVNITGYKVMGRNLFPFLSFIFNTMCVCVCVLLTGEDVASPMSWALITITGSWRNTSWKVWARQNCACYCCKATLASCLPSVSIHVRLLHHRVFWQWEKLIVKFKPLIETLETHFMFVSTLTWHDKLHCCLI